MATANTDRVVGDACTMPYTPGSAVAAGTWVQIGSGAAATQTMGYAQDAIASGVEGTVHIKGVFPMPKPAGALSQGDMIYFDGTDANSTATSNTPAGRIWESAASGDSTVQVAINHGIVVP